MVRKYITIDIKQAKEYNDLVCKYVFKKGKDENKRCYVRNYFNGYCLKHFKLVQKSELNKNTPRCQYKTINGICKRKCINDKTCKYHKKNKKDDLFLEKIEEKVKINKLICYYNDYKDKNKIKNIVIKDDIYVNNRSKPLLICYGNDNSLFKDYIKKNKKRMKKRKYRKKKKLDKLKINANIKIEYINEGYDLLGFPILIKRKSPFPDGKIIIDGILYINSYYEWKPVQKEVHLYCINLENNDEKKIVYSIDIFEKMLLDIYTKETVYKYFGY